MRFDHQVRRRDYEEALKAYLALPKPAPDRILFCDNSGACLESLKIIAESQNPHGKKVDFLSFISECAPERGKGYSEMDILDRAHETFFQSGDKIKNARIWKVTGRLVVKNLAKILAAAPADFDLYADFRSVPLIGESLGGNDWVDTRFFAYTPSGYERFLYKEKEDVGWTIEKSIYKKLWPRLKTESSIFPRFTRQPVFSGICAGSSKNYNSLTERAKNALRATTRCATPFVWI